MSYEKQNWQTGEIITADKLNHMEDGIASSVIIINAVAQIDDENVGGYSVTVDTTMSYNDIVNALKNGAFVIVRGTIQSEKEVPREYWLTVDATLSSMPTPSITAVAFSYLAKDTTGVSVYSFRLNGSNEWMFSIIN